MAFTAGCPGCEAADDAAIFHEIRWRLLRMRWFPYRVVEYLGLDENCDPVWGKTTWMPPGRGLIRWIMGYERRHDADPGDCGEDCA